MKMPMIHAAAIAKTYKKGNVAIPVLRGVDLQVEEGAFLGVMGASGSGKSTLLNIIGCLDRPTSGTYLLDGVDVLQSTDDQLSGLRSRCLGFVFQTFNLIPTLTIAENVALPFLYQSMDPDQIASRVATAMDEVGLTRRSHHRPAELSGGEMQRAAIARALVIRPKVILADEPTGNLDSATGREIMSVFTRLHRQGSTIILVTHDRDVASYADSWITICDGRIKRAYQ